MNGVAVRRVPLYVFCYVISVANKVSTKMNKISKEPKLTITCTCRKKAVS